MSISNKEPFYDPTKKGKIKPIEFKKQSNKKSMIAWILGISIIIIIVLLILYQFSLFNKDIEEKKFIGTWHIKTEAHGDFIGFDMKFNSNYTLEIGEPADTYPVGAWEISGNKLRLRIDTSEFSLYHGEYDYRFSDNDEKIELSYEENLLITLIKE